MLDAGALGAILVIGGGIETTISAANHLRRRSAVRDRSVAHGAPLAAAFTAPEQKALPADMAELLEQLDAPGGGHGGQGC